MFEVHLEGVRCFAKKQTVPIRPLTLLVGENSTGKSTLLAMVSCLMNVQFPLRLAANTPPYNLGGFDTLATHRGNQNGKGASFALGYTVNAPNHMLKRRVWANFGNEAGHAVLRKLKASHTTTQLKMSLTGLAFRGTLTGNLEAGPSRFEFEGELPVEKLGTLPLMGLVMDQIQGQVMQHPNARDYNAILSMLSPPLASCFSFAPIRTKPSRTYDEIHEVYSPEGAHIPYLLDRLLGQNPDAPESKKLYNALVSFGKDSGLFRKIDVKRLGKRAGEPFQVRVNTSGASFNLVDVGYGVSQVLPLVVQSVLKTSSDVMLIQQPEVHLHPRAQAALGTFFSNLAAGSSRYFLVETHSDYVLDRVRMEVAKGTIRAQDVVILYFEKRKQEAQIYPIHVDDMGNIEDPPPGYRSFFVREELNLLSRGAAHVLDR